MAVEFENFYADVKARHDDIAGKNKLNSHGLYSNTIDDSIQSQFLCDYF